jgi:hypothetical protein
LECQDATDASLIRRNSVGPARISLVSWRGPNYKAEATNELCFCWLSSRRISGALRGRILNPRPLLAAGHATSLFLSASDLARFGLIETLACSFHGYIPIPGPLPSPTSQGGLMELQA